MKFKNIFRYLDDPYYCGLKARVPNFAKAAAIANGKTNGTISEKKSFFGKKDKDSNKSKDKDKEKEKDLKEKEKEKDLKEKPESISPKQRPSVAQMPHPASFSTLYQLHQMQNGILHGGTMKPNGIFQRHNSTPEQYHMWHAKSYESGIGMKI